MPIPKKIVKLMARCRCSNPCRILLALWAFVQCVTASAGEPMIGKLPETSERLSMTALTVGNLGVLDEYLSPNVYDGIAVSLVGQRLHLMKHHQDWISQTMVRVGISNMTAHNRSGLMNSLTFDGRFSWQKIWIDGNGSFTVTAGPGLYTKVGGILNARNSNNPAQLKLYVAAAACGNAIYRFKLKNFPMSLNWQMEIPLIGYEFAPTFGLQYYEIGYFGRFSEASHFGWPGNSFGLSQIVSLDIPVGRVQLKLSYLGDYYRYDIGGLKTRMYENSFLVGFVRRIELKRNGR